MSHSSPTSEIGAIPGEPNMRAAMHFTEVNLFGVYISPFLAMMLVAAGATALLLCLLDRVRLTRRVWHPALFNAAVYVIVLSFIVIGAGGFF